MTQPFGPGSRDAGSRRGTTAAAPQEHGAHRSGGAASIEDVADGMLRALAEPALLATASGMILRVNAPAATLFGTAERALREAVLTDFLTDPADAVTRYLGACARTRSPMPGAVHLRPAAAGSEGAARPQRRAVVGSVVRPASAQSPAIVLLRFRADDAASNRFALLNRQIDELTREVRLRHSAELALLDANARLQQQAIELELANQRLQDQAVELEQQVDEASRLADDLEALNRALVQTNAELRAQTQAAEGARQEAEDANRAKSDFLAMMSHELRTPLNAIGGHVELLEIGVHGPVTDIQRETLARVQRAQRRLLGLINEVLTFARLEAGQVRYAPTELALDPLLRGLEALVDPQVRAQGLQYTYECTAGDVILQADPEKVEQIVLNLLSNAVKFTSPGGVVALAAEADTSLIRITVRDSGVGIPADKLTQIFEPFVQLDQTLTRSRDGVGLGLAISRDLARGMGGDLTVESAPGAGSTFTLTLPRA